MKILLLQTRGESLRSVVQPSIVEFHTLYVDEQITGRYTFDEKGRLSKFGTHWDDYTTLLKYHDDNRIKSIIRQELDGTLIEIQNVIYDVNGHVISIGERTFSYDPIDNSYTEDSSYNETVYYYDHFEEIEYSFRKYSIANSTNPIVQYCRYEGYIITNMLSGEVTETLACNGSYQMSISYFDNNVLSRSQDSFGTSFAYDSNPNPLYHQSSNLEDILGFLYGTINTPKDQLLFTISANNRIFTHWDNDGGPETTEYIFELILILGCLLILPQNITTSAPTKGNT